MSQNDKNVTIEDVTIAFRNFAGKEDKYNRAGDRNFSIFLDEDLAQQMERDGWNVRRLRDRDDGEVPQAYLTVALRFENKPPKICMVTKKNLSYLDESQVEMLDWVDIETADITLNPYDWTVGDKSGRKAYVKSLFIKIEEDYLQDKWTNFVEGQRAITSGADDYLDGEIVDEPLAIGR